MSTTKEIGDQGEEAAVQYLKSRGYRILERNYKIKIGTRMMGELDIISQKGRDLVFVEVKTRLGQAGRYSPFDNITDQKRKKLLKLARFYIKTQKIPLDSPHQIDVIAVEMDFDKPTKIEHLEREVYC